MARRVRLHPLQYPGARGQGEPERAPSVAGHGLHVEYRQAGDGDASEGSPRGAPQSSRKCHEGQPEKRHRDQGRKNQRGPCWHEDVEGCDQHTVERRPPQEIESAALAHPQHATTRCEHLVGVRKWTRRRAQCRGARQGPGCETAEGTGPDRVGGAQGNSGVGSLCQSAARPSADARTGAMASDRTRCPSGDGWTGSTNK